jgi:hypothetical protein
LGSSAPSSPTPLKLRRAPKPPSLAAGLLAIQTAAPYSSLYLLLSVAAVLSRLLLFRHRLSEERPAPSLLSTDARFLSQPPSNQSRRTGNRSNNLQSTMAHVLSCWASRNAHAHRLDTHCRLLHAALSMTRDGTLASPLPGTVNVANQQSACAPRGLALSRARLVFDFGRPVCTCGAMWHFRPKM